MAYKLRLIMHSDVDIAAMLELGTEAGLFLKLPFGCFVESLLEVDFSIWKSYVIDKRRPSSLVHGIRCAAICIFIAGRFLAALIIVFFLNDQKRHDLRLNSRLE